MPEPEPNRNLKRFYVAFREWFVGYLDDIDPLQLLTEYGPEREYEPEVARIIPLIESARSSDDLAVKMHAIFVMMFDDNIAGDVSSYKPIAVRAIEKWKALRRDFGLGANQS